MKKLFMLLLVCMPLLSLAGGTELALNGGFHIWTKGGAGPYASLRLQSNQDVAIGGIGIDVGSYGSEITLPYVNMQGQQTAFTDQASSYFINPSLYASYKFALPVGYLYAGINMGYFMLTRDVYAYEEVQASPSYTVIHKFSETRRSVSVGLQAGFTTPVSDKISFSIETGFRYIPIRIDQRAFIPGLLGFAYRF